MSSLRWKSGFETPYTPSKANNNAAQPNPLSTKAWKRSVATESLTCWSIDSSIRMATCASICQMARRISGISASLVWVLRTRNDSGQVVNAHYEA
jgi:hypothetical protein